MQIEKKKEKKNVTYCTTVWYRKLNRIYVQLYKIKQSMAKNEKKLSETATENIATVMFVYKNKTTEILSKRT